MTEIKYGAYLQGEKQSACLRSVFDRFEAQTGIKVHIDNTSTPLTELAHSQYTETALHRQGPDLTDIGSTWVNDMAAMNALRPFTAAEVAHIAPESDFPPASWQSCYVVGDPQQWAIPWNCNVALINYRPDLLAQAGVDENTAFQSLATLTKAAEQLQAAGIDAPVEIAYHRRDRFMMMHAMAGWVWSNGAEFIHADGKQVLFNQPATIETICAYFGLLRYLSPRGRQWMYESQSDLFRQGKAAITFRCYPMNQLGLDGVQTAPEVEAHWQVLPYPKVAWLGGQNLVVWKHTRYAREAIELIRYLSSVPVQVQLAKGFYGYIPARLPALEDPSLQQDRTIRVASQAVRSARSYLSVRLWGLVEDRLMNALIEIEEGVLDNPSINLHSLAHSLLDPQAIRLNMTLTQLSR